MKAYDLARELLKGEDLEVTASIDISKGEEDNMRRIFTVGCFGINSHKGDGGVITILFDADPVDNQGKKI